MKKYLSNYSAHKKYARKPLITALEPRLLLDGAAVATAVDVLTDSQLHNDASQTDTNQHDTDTSLVIAPTEVRAVDPSLNNGKKEVVFIETNVTDYQTLVDGVGAGTEVVLLDASQDGLAQMALWAQSHSDYDAIHVISHGSEGQINLGDFSLDITTASTRSSDLAQLGNALNEEGDLLLYGCSVASGEGQDFVAALAQATQADVAASDDLTGSTSKSGDWELEHKFGEIEISGAVISTESQNSFDGVLADVTISNSISPDSSPASTDGSTGVWGQSFIATKTGVLSSINLIVSTAAQSDVTLSVYSDEGVGGALLHSQTVSASELSHVAISYTDWETINLSETVHITSGNSYTFVFGDSDPVQFYYHTNTYADGGIYSSVNGGILADYDLLFEVVQGDAAVTNTAPTLSNLNSDSVAWAGVGNTVVLDSSTNATVTDTELDALNTGSGDYSGASLTVARSAGAWSADTFDFGQNGYTVNGSNLQSGGQTFATFTNTGGTLSINFTSSGTTATTALVNAVMKDISYRNDTPAGDAIIRYTLSDGNSSTTADVTVTSDTIYVTNTIDTATIDVSNGVSFSEAVAIAAADNTGSQTLVLDSALAGQSVTLAGNLAMGESLLLNGDAASGVTFTGSTITMASGQTLTINNGSGDTATMTSQLAGAGAIEKAGAGTLTLSNSSNSYGGGTTVSAGTLSGTASSLVGNITNNSTVEFSQSSDGTYSGIISGNGSLTKSGSGAVTLTGANTYTGATTVSAGNLVASGGSAIANTSALTVASGATFTMNNSETVGSIAGAGSISIAANGGTLTVGGNNTSSTFSGVMSGTGGLTKVGSGAFTLSGANTYTGATTVSAGGLTLSNSGGNALADTMAVTLSGTAALTLATNETIGSLSGTSTNTISLGSNTLTTGGNNADTHFSGVMSGTGGLTKAGSGAFTLSGANTYTGATTVSSGTVNVQNGSAIADTSAVTVASGATFHVENVTSETIGSLAGAGTVSLNGGTLTLGGDNSSTTFSGVIQERSSSGALTKTGSGTLTLSGTNTYSGATSLNAGTLSVTGALSATSGVMVYSGATLAGTGAVFAASSTNNLTVNSGGFLSPGVAGAGQLTVNGNLVLNGTLNADITGTTAGTDYDQVVVNGAVTLGANSAFDVTYSVSGGGNTFVLIDNDGSDVVSGTLSGVAEGGSLTSNSRTFQTSYIGGTGNDVTLKDSSAPVITSGATGSVNENAATNTVIYTATATDADNDTISFSLTGTDAALLNINSTTGAVTLKASADYETKSSYSFNVVATDNGTGNLNSSKAITVSVNDVNDNTPVITSTSTGSVDENADISTVIYTVAGTDADGTATNNTLRYSLTGTDASLLDINSTTGVVTLKASADYETKSSYSFNVVATDNGAGNFNSGSLSVSKAITVSVNDVNDNTPVITSTSTGSVDENADISTVIYTVTGTDADGTSGNNTLSYSVTGTDAALLNINSTTGAVTLKASADYETKSSYSFNVVATDNGTGSLTDTKAITVSVNNVNDAPVISSGATSNVDENAGISTVIYTVTATDADSNTLSYSLTGTDAALLDINSATGAVTLKASADYETKSSYSFNVVATDNGTGSLTDTKAITVSVNNVNDAPVISSGATSNVDENADISTVIYTVTATDADSNTLSYSLTGTDAALLNINSATGAVTLKASADYETKSSYSFNVVATDNGTGNLTDTKAITVSVNNVNDAPVISSGATSNVDENADISTVIYTVTATDADSNTLSYSLTGTDAALLNINSATGAVTLKASADYETKSSYSFNVVATDNGTGSLTDTKAITVSVNNVNDAPVISSGATSNVDENADISTVIYTVTATDADSNTLSYSLTGTDAALLNINSATGAVTLKASADYETKSSYSFNVVATDNGTGSLTDTKAITVSVNNVNDAPVISSGATSNVDENAGISTVIYTVTATDADSNTLSYSLTGTDAALLDINSATGAVTLKASADYETKSSYSFNVVATDNGTGSLTDTKAITVSVNNVNDAPVISSGATSNVDENADISTVIYTVTATDADSNTLSYSLTGTDAALLNINSATGAVTLKASADYETKSSYSFNVVATDNGTGSLTDTKAITVSVNNVNDAPVISSGATSNVDENAGISTVIYTVTATDADSNTLSYSLTGTDAALLDINSATGVVTLKASADYETKSSYSFNVVATDNGTGSLTDTKAITVSVNDVNDSTPVITSTSTGSVDENADISTVIYTVTGTDADGTATNNTLRYSLTGTDASLLDINSTTGVVTLKASADYETKSSYSFNVVATDNGAGNFNSGSLSVSKAITVSVNDVNDNTPVITSTSTGSVDENADISTVIYTVAGTDADGTATNNTLRYSLTGTDASLLDINSTTGVVTLKASADYETKSSYSFNVVATDNGAGNFNSGSLSVSKAITVSVNDVNDNTPVITSTSTGSVDENADISTVIYTVTGTDADGTSGNNTLSYSVTGTDAALLNINSTTGAVTLKASADYETKSSYSFNVVATDNGTGNLTDTKAITVSVNNVNDAPVISSGATSNVDENADISTVIYTVTATDADSNTLSYSLTGTDAALLNINSATGAVTLKASADYETKSSYSFNVVATDNGTGSLTDTKAITVSVNNVNDAPVISSGATSNVDENAGISTVIYTVTATDADSNTLSYSLTGTDAALLDINSATGVVTLKASADYETKSSYSFNVVATDNGTGSLTDTKAITVSVNDVNDSTPVITSTSTGSVDENADISTVIYTVTGTDADGTATNNTLRYSLTGTDASLLDINSTTGVVTLKASADYETKSSYSFNVVATDNGAGNFNSGSLSVSKAITVSVNDVNDNTPVITSTSTGSVDENADISTVIYTVAGTDSDGTATNNTLRYSLTGTDASLLDINSTTGVVTLKASADYEIKSSYSFNVVATDNGAGNFNSGSLSVSKAITVSVNDVNDNTPVITSTSTGSVDENADISTVIYTVAGTDADGTATNNTLRYSLTGTDASLLDINSTTGVVTLKASADYETKSSYSFNVVATDNGAGNFNSGSLSVSKAITVSVNDVNDNTPVITSTSTGSVDENADISTVIYTVTGTDADGTSGNNTLSYSVTGTDAALLNINSTTGAVTLKASADYETKSSYSFNVVATDNGTGNLTDTKAITVSVNNVNDAPVISSGATSNVDENADISTVIYTVTATDADSNTLSYSLTGTDAALLNINSATGAVTLKASADYETKSSYSFNVVATDNGTGSLTDTKAITVSVNNVNDAPVISSGATSNVDENAGISTVIYTVTATDADSNTLSYSLTGTDAALLDINSATGVVTLKASADYETKSSYSFNVVATDNGTGSLTDTKAITVSVNDVNDSTPVITSTSTGSVDENADISTVIYTVTGTDADGTATNNTLRYSLTGTDASLLDINSTTGVVTLKASADYETKSSYSFNVVATDNGAGNFNSGSLSVSKAITVSVNDVNDNTPVITSTSTGSVDENADISTVIYTVAGTDSDGTATNNTLRYSLTGTDASLLDINSTTGVVTLKASADYEIKSSYSFNVVATDNGAGNFNSGSLSVSKAITVSVNDVNDNTPVITSTSTGSVDENADISTVIYTVAGTDADGTATNNTLRYSLTGTDASLLDINSTTGVVTLKASADYETKSSYSFNVIATDNGAGNFNSGSLSVSKAITVSVNDVNDNTPVITSISTGSVDENADISTVIYTVTGTDADGTSGNNTLSYSVTGTDAALLNINSTTGAVTLKASADYETKSSYSFNVVATDNGTGNLTGTKAITVSVNNMNDAPVISSGATSNVDENADISTVIYTVTATDADSNALSYSLTGTDAALLDINSATGAVTLKASADYETTSSYSFNVVATDNGAGNFNSGNLSVSKAITVSVNDVNDTPSTNVPTTPVVTVPTPVNAPIPTNVSTTFIAPIPVPTAPGFSSPALSLNVNALPPGTIDSGSGASGFVEGITALGNSLTTSGSEDSTVSSSSVSVNVGANGQVEVTQAEGASQNTTGLTIANMDVQSDRVQITVADTGVGGSYSATLADGTSLPSWVSVNPTTGEVTLTPPPGQGEITLKINAVDANGNARVLEVKVDLANLPDATQGQPTELNTQANGVTFVPLDEQLAVAAEQFDDYGNDLMKLLAS
ncbi:hypothetical protein A8139_10410 [Marinomonas primoryensis]|uniref:Cadherin domain-containing protein n=1 Tax=Marinomonas primoryensis TaxID=178399 RepID=A0A2Z4PS34_9GAMM|nr:cadherin domain-containing protein [Marinomonas primoryensis]AWY00366.1 hypothetical protein A8139_10410 [Marinomonas primoryensis]